MAWLSIIGIEKLAVKSWLKTLLYVLFAKTSILFMDEVVNVLK